MPGSDAGSLGGRGLAVTARQRVVQAPARADPELGEHLLQVPLDGARAEEQLARRSPGSYSPSRASRAICSSWGVSSSRVSSARRRTLLAGGQQLAPRALGERRPRPSRRTPRGRCRSCSRASAAGPRGAATRRTADARGRAPGAAACGPGGRSPRGRSARRPRPRPAARGRAPRCRAPIPSRPPACCSSSRVSARAASVGRPRSGWRPRSARRSAQADMNSSGVSPLATVAAASASS